MGLHSDTEIFKTAYELHGIAYDVVKHAHRNVKPMLIHLLIPECLELLAIIADANIAIGGEKVPHFYLLLRNLGKVEILLRTAHERGDVPTAKFGPALALLTSVGKQANALKTKFSPVT